MSDDKSKTGNADRVRINLSEDYEVRDWAKKFGVTEDALRRAAERVGPRLRTHSQNRTVAARAMADRKTVGQRS
ncbi:DUF3606 domain-containing protein [Brevundimonas nasdae]|uniref:DUF3606 domain-containing protein n=1 Tax=Brevundimonas nasdae TaxID=172043 RepID=UPI000A02FF9B|nr:DUF3606 domain-containing protein [Brevundimonas nasdae]